MVKGFYSQPIKIKWFTVNLLKERPIQVFITGTDTNVGKTLVASWLCLHTGYEYFKPIQTGSIQSTDSHTISLLSNSLTHKEVYLYKAPVSPHLASKLEGEFIDLTKIQVPKINQLIIEGAGGVMVPLNQNKFMIDLIKQLKVPVILVTRSTLGTINHTLSSLMALRSRKIPTLGVIVNGESNHDNCDAIEYYGQTKVLAQILQLSAVNKESLQAIPLTHSLKTIFGIK